MEMKSSNIFIQKKNLISLNFQSEKVAKNMLSTSPAQVN